MASTGHSCRVQLILFTLWPYPDIDRNAKLTQLTFQYCKSGFRCSDSAGLNGEINLGEEDFRHEEHAGWFGISLSNLRNVIFPRTATTRCSWQRGLALGDRGVKSSFPSMLYANLMMTRFQTPKAPPNAGQRTQPRVPPQPSQSFATRLPVPPKRSLRKRRATQRLQRRRNVRIRCRMWPGETKRI